MDHIEKQKEKSIYPYFHSGINFIALVAAIVNIILAVFYLYIGFYIGTIAQTTGALLFIFLKIKFDKGLNASLIFQLMLLIVTLQCILNSLLMGIDSGYLLYLFILPVVFLLNPYWNVKHVFACLILLTAVFIGSYYFLINHDAVYKLSELQLHTIYLLNLSLCVAGGFSSLLFFKYINIINRNKLIASNTQLHKRNEEIKKEYRKQKVLLKEIHHRVKNNLQIISSMLSLQKYKLNDQAMIDILENSQSRIHAISLIHQKLFQQEELAVVNMNFYLQDLVESLNHLNPNINCKINAIDLSINLDIAVPLGLITAEALSNSYKHAFQAGDKGKVEVTLNKKKKNTFLLNIQDNGKGFPINFDIEKTQGLGMEIILTLSEQIDANTNFGTNEKGAFYSIEFNAPEVVLIG